MPRPSKPTHGGQRKGAGRPKGVPTRILSIRVPSAHYDRLRAAVRELVARLLGHIL
jgi:hypothetical protein